jgi:hypothetical protein
MEFLQEGTEVTESFGHEKAREGTKKENEGPEGSGSKDFNAEDTEFTE